MSDTELVKEETALATMVTQEHKNIAQLFAEKVIHHLSNVKDIGIEQYGIDTAYFTDSERLKLRISDKIDLTVEINTRTR